MSVAVKTTRGGTTEKSTSAGNPSSDPQPPTSLRMRKKQFEGNSAAVPNFGGYLVSQLVWISLIFFEPILRVLFGFILTHVFQQLDLDRGALAAVCSFLHLRVK